MGEAPRPQLNSPVVVDLAPVRCPASDARIAAEWRRTTPRLKPQLCPETGKAGLCKGQLKAQIDSLHESEARKNAAGLVQERDNAECREPAKKAKGRPVS